MATPYLSELKLVSFNFPPKNWAMANGQVLPINQNQALFALLGTTFGGNGQNNFALPNLQGRVPLHMGTGYNLGQNGGEAAVTLPLTEIPSHQHTLQGAGVTFSQTAPPANNLLCNTTGNLGIYGPANSLQAMFAGDIGNTGSSQPHTNQSPYLVMTWIIALNGIFPSRN